MVNESCMLDENEENSIELAYHEYTRNRKESEMEEVIEDISKLLSVTEENFEFVSEQKWFQRAWYTLSKRNKKLQKVNEVNLLKIQSGSIIFLQNLVKEHTNLAKVLRYNLNRVDSIETESELVKDFVYEWTNRNNIRNRDIDMRLGRIERKVGDVKPIDDEFTVLEEENNSYKKPVKELYSKIYKQLLPLFTGICFGQYLKFKALFEEIYNALNEHDDDTQATVNLMELSIQSFKVEEDVDKANCLEAVSRFADMCNDDLEDTYTNFLSNSPYRLSYHLTQKDKMRMYESINVIMQNYRNHYLNINVFADNIIEHFLSYKKLALSNDVKEYGKLIGKGLVAGLFGPIGIAGVVADAFVGDIAKEKLMNSLGYQTKNQKANEFTEYYPRYLDINRLALTVELDEIKTEIEKEFMRFINEHIVKVEQAMDEFTILRKSLRPFHKDVVDTLKELEIKLSN